MKMAKLQKKRMELLTQMDKRRKARLPLDNVRGEFFKVFFFLRKAKISIFLAGLEWQLSSPRSLSVLQEEKCWQIWGLSASSESPRKIILFVVTLAQMTVSARVRQFSNTIINVPTLPIHVKDIYSIFYK